MADDQHRTKLLNELMRECFRLNRSLLGVSQQLTDGTSVTGAQWGVLTALAQRDPQEDPLTVAETARRMGLARQSVQRVTDVLEENGLVEYLPNPADKRAKYAVVTRVGNRLLTTLEDRQLRWVADIVSGHSSEDIRTAMLLIRDIRDKITSQLDAEDLRAAAG